ncbi:2518_t:CDS:1, partial [Dentiscutata heterogama]
KITMNQNAEELYQLGQKYIEGFYIGIDRKKAFEYFRKAADL